jgi:hypothetical protein
MLGRYRRLAILCHQILWKELVLLKPAGNVLLVQFSERDILRLTEECSRRFREPLKVARSHDADVVREHRTLTYVRPINEA